MKKSTWELLRKLYKAFWIVYLAFMILLVCMTGIGGLLLDILISFFVVPTVLFTRWSIVEIKKSSEFNNRSRRK